MALKRALRVMLHSKQPLTPSWTKSPRLMGRWRCTKRTGFQGTIDGCAAFVIMIARAHTPGRELAGFPHKDARATPALPAASDALLCCNVADPQKFPSTFKCDPTCRLDRAVKCRCRESYSGMLCCILCSTPSKEAIDCAAGAPGTI